MTREHDEWCPKNGCRCGDCKCARLPDCPPPTEFCDFTSAVVPRRVLAVQGVGKAKLETGRPRLVCCASRDHGGDHLMGKPEQRDKLGGPLDA